MSADISLRVIKRKTMQLSVPSCGPFLKWFSSLLGVKFPSMDIWDPLKLRTGSMGKVPCGRRGKAAPGPNLQPCPTQVIESCHVPCHSGSSLSPEYHWPVAATLRAPNPSPSS